MANRIEGVQENIIRIATKEFLEHGYQNASLRRIAAEAGTSTNSIYVRFRDKEGLFREIVRPVADAFRQMYAGESDYFEQNTPDMPYEEMFCYSSEVVKPLLDYVYAHFDSFRLLICCANGTYYSDFIHDLAEVEAKSTMHYLEAVHNAAFSSGKISLQFLHMVSSAYLTGFFEIVKHDMTREEAGIYVKQLQRFFYEGWKDLFEIG